MRVIEIFGPTVQGEGPYAGRVCHFLRLGGCDFRCSWCDTPHAVLPELVRDAPDLTIEKVADELAGLPQAPMLVISGGNPALHKLDKLLDVISDNYDVIGIETQGSKYKPWIARLGSIVVSPKPPSSGEATERNWKLFEEFMLQVVGNPRVVLKIVVFDGDDLEWASKVHENYPDVPLYLSAGTDQDDADHGDTVAAVGRRYGWLCEQVVSDERLHDACVLPQLHVVAWGHRVGV